MRCSLGPVALANMCQLLKIKSGRRDVEWVNRVRKHVPARPDDFRRAEAVGGVLRVQSHMNKPTRT